MSTVRTQKASDGTWYDEKGTQCPYSRVSKLERFIEKGTGQLLKKATRVNTQLVELKKDFREFSEELYREAMIQAGVEDPENTSKGNFQKYNFDRSIRFEVDVKDRTEFDDLTIQAAKEKLDEFLAARVTSDSEFVKQMVLDAFQTTKGNLDVKKVMGLLRYESKVKDKRFLDACSLIKDAIRIPNSKSYFRISVRNEEGGYDQVQLNFSSI